MDRPDDPTFGSATNSQPQDKAALRADIRSARRRRRDSTSHDTRTTAAQRVVGFLLEHPALRTARCIALYEALPTEQDVSPLTQLAPEAGRFIVPVTLPDKDLSWRDLATGEDMGREGIAAADVVVVPALAIGPSGERLGQGGGSYDRALPRRRPGTPVIAVVFPDETDQAVPTEPHDERVDAVATSTGLQIFR